MTKWSIYKYVYVNYNYINDNDEEYDDPAVYLCITQVAQILENVGR